MSTDLNSGISKVINQPLMNIGYRRTTEPLLHTICSNSLGKIIKFIFYVSDSFDVFSIQDDDGNTPLHLLSKRNHFLEIDYTDDSDNYHYSDNTNIFEDISSELSLTKVFCLLQYLSNYIDFSVKNKNGKTIFDEFHNNILINNIYYIQSIRKKAHQFPLNKPKLNERVSNIAEWNELFKLKDPQQKHRTLLHYLFMGDRLSAIKFLVNQGADVNYWEKEKNYGQYIRFPVPIFYLFEVKSFKYKNDSYQKSIDLVVPSGFKKIPEAKTGNPLDYDYLLDQREKRILEETEKIAEFLIECGSDLILESHVPYCDISDIMYRIHQKKNIEEKHSVIDKLKNLSKRISNTLMDCSCFPFGCMDRTIYCKSNKEVKYIKLESYHDQNQEELED